MALASRGATFPIVVLINIACATSSQQPETSVPTVHGIGLQSLRSEVVEALGVPLSERSEEYDRTIIDYGDATVLTYPALTVHLYSGYQREDWRVLELTVLHPGVIVVPGLEVGIPKEEVFRLLGPELPSRETWLGEPGDVDFHFNYDLPPLDTAILVITVDSSGMVKRLRLSSDWD